MDLSRRTFLSATAVAGVAAWFAQPDVAASGGTASKPVADVALAPDERAVGAGIRELEGLYGRLRRSEP